MLMTELHIPAHFNKRDHRCNYRIDGETALLIYLHRMANADCYAHQLLLFGGNLNYLSQAFHVVSKHIHTNFSHVLTDLNRWAPLIPAFADKIHKKTSQLYPHTYQNVFGFVDGKLFATARPIRDQREFYNGHKKDHGIKEQSVSLPNGMIAHWWGPIPGRRHDKYLLGQSKLVADIKAMNVHMGNPHPPLWAIYGDPAYPLQDAIMCPYTAAVTNRQQQMNHAMSSCRVSVEWGFARVIQYWKFVDTEICMKVLEGPLQEYVDNAVLLTNLLTILYGGIMTAHFDCEDNLSIQEYLA